jgi:hypothetical protein
MSAGSQGADANCITLGATQINKETGPMG